jgi:hypothetical protein
MFRKSIDSVLKRAVGIVADLDSIAMTCNDELEVVEAKIQELDRKGSTLVLERNRAQALSDKWSELVL